MLWNIITTLRFYWWLCCEYADRDSIITCTPFSLLFLLLHCYMFKQLDYVHALDIPEKQIWLLLANLKPFSLPFLSTLHSVQQWYCSLAYSTVLWLFMIYNTCLSFCSLNWNVVNSFNLILDMVSSTYSTVVEPVWFPCLLKCSEVVTMISLDWLILISFQILTGKFPALKTQMIHHA